jgi:hypothetical protein
MPTNPERVKVPLRIAFPCILAFAGVCDAQMTDGKVIPAAVHFLMDSIKDEAPADVTGSIGEGYSPIVVDVATSNEISSRMMNDLTPYQPVDPDWAYEQMQESGKNSKLFGEKISIEDTMRYFYMAGFRGIDLQIITAISQRESVGGYPGAVGDSNYKDSGSISVGLTQIRCITEGDKLPCVGPRDWRTNFDPAQSARNTFAIYQESIGYYGYGEEGMRYNNQFRPWKWYQEHVEKYGLDPAENVFLPMAIETYNALQANYGDLSA